MSYLNRNDTGSSHGSQSFNRPFSTNNPFRNSSVDSSINDPKFQSWVNNNNRQSQLSISSDEDEFDHFRVPSLPRPAVDRQLSTHSTGSVSSVSRMPPPPRRASNNPFDSHGNQSNNNSNTNSNSNNTNGNQLPVYESNEETNRFYNTDEKRRQEQQSQARSPPPPRSRGLASQGDLPPPSYDDVVPKSKSSSTREKSSSFSRSQPQPTHRTRSRSELSPAERERLEEKERERARRHRERRGNGEQTSSSREHQHHSSSSSDASRRHKSSRGDPKHSSSSRHASSRSKAKEEKPKQPAKNVDTIDKLDVTGLFGVGFHHDGPFDACTPHRNVNVKAAPVMAFPVDGANNSIRGSNNSGKNSTINYIQGIEDNDDDLYTTSVSNNDYSRLNGSNSTISAIKTDSNRFSSFDATGKVSKVHGQTTLGLGSSTFLDGAPASETSQLEDAHARANAGGLRRNKSLRQKILGEEGTPVSNGGIRFSEESQREKEDKEGNSLLRRVKSLRVGRKN